MGYTHTCLCVTAFPHELFACNFVGALFRNILFLVQGDLLVCVCGGGGGGVFSILSFIRTVPTKSGHVPGFILRQPDELFLPATLPSSRRGISVKSNWFISIYVNTTIGSRVTLGLA